MKWTRPATATTLLIGALFGLPATHADAQSTQPDEAQAAREQKARELQPHRRSAFERILFTVEDKLVLNRWLDPPRGVFVRVGNMGEGAGFARRSRVPLQHAGLRLQDVGGGIDEDVLPGRGLAPISRNDRPDQLLQGARSLRRALRPLSRFSSRGLLRSGS